MACRRLAARPRRSPLLGFPWWASVWWAPPGKALSPASGGSFFRPHSAPPNGTQDHYNRGHSLLHHCFSVMVCMVLNLCSFFSDARRFNASILMSSSTDRRRLFRRSTDRRGATSTSFCLEKKSTISWSMDGLYPAILEATLALALAFGLRTVMGLAASCNFFRKVLKIPKKSSGGLDLALPFTQKYSRVSQYSALARAMRSKNSATSS
mmetsp:Transcript_10577/g.22881  ORF Transcript_10577/g.22881 Transcript_10577/m.22881 type:complete len:209 (+) Transcript_10577:244-870(+)